MGGREKEEGREGGGRQRERVENEQARERASREQEGREGPAPGSSASRGRQPRRRYTPPALSHSVSLTLSYSLAPLLPLCFRLSLSAADGRGLSLSASPPRTRSTLFQAPFLALFFPASQK